MPFLPSKADCQVWEPSQRIVSAVVTALLNKRQDPEAVVVTPASPLPAPRAANDTRSTISWPAVPLSKPSATKHKAYKTSSQEFNRANLRPEAIPTSLDRLKVTYGTIRPRPPVWGPR